MAEEATLDAIEQTDVDVSANPHEELARQGGWKPLEEWDKAPEDWVDAKTFNRNGEYMERIKSQSSLIKKLEKRQAQTEATLKDLAEHHNKVKELEYDRALKDLKALKKDALDLGDHERVVEIDDKILDLKKADDKKTVASNTPEMHEDVIEWIENNPWYNSDPALAGAANGIVADIINKEPHLQGQVREVLDRATTKLKEEFPQKFGVKPKNSRVTEPSSTEASTRSSSTPKVTARQLDEEHKKIGKRLVAAGALKNLDEYAQQLAEIGGL